MERGNSGCQTRGLDRNIESYQTVRTEEISPDREKNTFAQIGLDYDYDMQIIDLSPEYEELYFVCLEDWSDEIKEGAERKRKWFEKHRERGLRVKLALDDDGRAGGMIQYLPVEYSFARGENLYFINCIWVHGHKKGRGNFQKKGMGQALLAAAEEDARHLGANGMAAWGLVLPFWMRAGWYKKKGYHRADRDGLIALVWKPFHEKASPPSIYRRRKLPQSHNGKVTVTAFNCGQCTVQNMVCERARRAAAEFGERVFFEEVDTSDPEVFREWGVMDGLYINGREMRTGPPPSYETIRNWMARRVKKIPEP